MHGTRTATIRQLIVYWVNRYASSTKVETPFEGGVPNVFLESRALLLKAIDMLTVLVV